MTEDKNIHTQLHELVINASYQIRKILGIDDLSHTVSVSSSNDPKKYYLLNALNEVDKSAISLKFACEFLDANKNQPPPIDGDTQFNSKILQSKIDELSVWHRKLVEILIDLIGFRSANSLDYYIHYNMLHKISRKEKEVKDRKEFWGCNNRTLEKEIQDLQLEADQLARQLNPLKCWYTKNNKNNIVLNDERSRFKTILKNAKNFEKALLLSYRNSFGQPSELLHPKRILDEKDITLEDFTQAIRGVGILGLHVISGIKDLLQIHNVNGSLKKIANAVKKNSFPIFLLELRTKSKMVVNDFVITPCGPAQITKVSKNDYGYKTFHVKFLLAQASKIQVEEYIPEEISLLAPYKIVKKNVLKILNEANPNLHVSGQRINRALKKQIIELWSLNKSKIPGF
jgi:hypothetical protein